MNRKLYEVAGPFIVMLILILLLFTGCEADKQQPPAGPSPQPNYQAPDQNGTDPQTDTMPQEDANTQDNANTPVPSPEIKEAGFVSGMYKIGQDMPAGEYKLFSTDGLIGISYFEIAKDSSNSIESIVANDNFFSFTYVTVSDGQYFKFTDARAVPVDDAEVSGPVEGRYPSGMYKVGVDIPAGEYKVMPEEGSTLGFGYFEITTSSKHALNDIVANDNFEDPRYITLASGQYLKLSEAYIQAGG